MRYSSTLATIVVIVASTVCNGAPEATTQPANLLLNGDAEQGKSGQPSIWFEASVRADGLKMQQDTTQAHSGKASLYIENTHKYDQPVANNWGQTLQDVPVGKTLRLSAAIKTADAESANVCLQCWDASGEKMLAFASTPVVRGDQDWTTLKTEPITVPADTKSIMVRAALGGTGKVWFDDLVVTESDKPATAPLAQTPVQQQPSIDLNQVAGGKVVGRIPIARDQMVLAYLPDWSYGNVDNIAIANNQGGVRTLFRWGDVSATSGKRFVLAVYSRKTTVGENPSPIGAFEILDDWNEQTSWTRQPKTAAEPAATFEFKPEIGWKTFDITPLVQKQIKAGKTFGVELRFIREDADVKKHCGYTCVSREGEGGWEDRRPVLLIVE